MYKADLRKTYLLKRKNISRSLFWSLNEKLIEQIKEIDWDQYKLAHVFMPIAKNNEIDTFSILNYFKEEEPNLQIVIPRTDFEKLEMSNILFDPVYTIFGKNKYDIPEPIHGKVIPSSQIDIVLMPLLAFDQKGNRVGYGKGFYDRFLSKCRPDVQKIGISFFDPVDEITDTDPFDIPLNACITPDKIWEF